MEWAASIPGMESGVPQMGRKGVEREARSRGERRSGKREAEAGDATALGFAVFEGEAAVMGFGDLAAEG